MQNSTNEECMSVHEFYINDLSESLVVQVIFGSIYAVIFVLGLIGNVSVMLKVLINRKLHTARNAFLLGETRSLNFCHCQKTEAALFEIIVKVLIYKFCFELFRFPLFRFLEI